MLRKGPEQDTLAPPHLRQELASEAEKSFRDAIEVDPHDDEALLLIGTLLAGQKKYSEPLTSSREAMKAAPDSVEGFGTLKDLESIDRTMAYLDELRFE